MNDLRLSVTQLNMLSFCGEQYRRRYILGEKRPPGVSALVGRATDKSVNDNMTSKIETGELLPLENIQDIARDALNNAWAEQGVLLTEDEVREGLKKVKGGAVDKSVRLSKLHYTDLAPALQPTHVQRSWELPINGYPVTLVGYIDLQEGLKSIRDTKTAAKAPPANIADLSDQLTMYALAVMQYDGKIPDWIYLDYLIDTKVPKTVSVPTQRKPEDFNSIFARIEMAIKIIETGLFMPARQDHYLCDPRFCGFASTCRYYRRMNK